MCWSRSTSRRRFQIYACAEASLHSFFFYSEVLFDFFGTEKSGKPSVSLSLSFCLFNANEGLPFIRLYCLMNGAEYNRIYFIFQKSTFFKKYFSKFLFRLVALAELIWISKVFVLSKIEFYFLTKNCSLFFIFFFNIVSNRCCELIMNIYAFIEVLVLTFSH